MFYSLFAKSVKSPPVQLVPVATDKQSSNFVFPLFVLLRLPRSTTLTF